MASLFRQLLIITSLSLYVMLTAPELPQEGEMGSAIAQLSSSLYVVYEYGLCQEFPDIAKGTYDIVPNCIDYDLVSSGHNAIAPHCRQLRYGELLFDISSSAYIVVVYNMIDGHRFTLRISFQPKMIEVHVIESSLRLYVFGFVGLCHSTWELAMQTFSHGYCRNNEAGWCPYSSNAWKVQTGVSCREEAPSATFARLEEEVIVLMDTQCDKSCLVYIYASPGSELRCIMISDLLYNRNETRLYWNRKSLETSVQVKTNGKYSMFMVDLYGSATSAPAIKSLNCPMLTPWLFNCKAGPFFLNATGSFIPLIHTVGEPWYFIPPGVGSSVVYIRRKLLDDEYEVYVCRPDLHEECQVLPLTRDVCNVSSPDTVTVVNDGLELVVTVCEDVKKPFFEVYIFTEGRYVAIKSVMLLPKIGGSIVQMLSFGQPFISMLPPDGNHQPKFLPHTSNLPTVLMSTIIPIAAIVAVCVLHCSIALFAVCIYCKRKGKRSYRNVTKEDGANQHLLVEMEGQPAEDDQHVKPDPERSVNCEQTQTIVKTAEDCVDSRPDISGFGDGVLSQPGEPQVVVVEVHDHPSPSALDSKGAELDNASPVNTPPGDDTVADTCDSQEDRECKSVCKGCEMHCGSATKGSGCTCQRSHQQQCTLEQASNDFPEDADDDSEQVSLVHSEQQTDDDRPTDLQTYPTPASSNIQTKVEMQPPNMRREPIGDVADQASAQPPLAPPPAHDEEPEPDVPEAREEAKSNASQTSRLVMNPLNPPLTDRKKWPKCDGR